MRPIARLRQFLLWRQTIIVRPPLVLLLMVLDVAYRILGPRLETGIARNPQALKVVDLVTGLVLFFLLLLFAAGIYIARPTSKTDSTQRRRRQGRYPIARLRRLLTVRRASGGVIGAQEIEMYGRMPDGEVIQLGSFRVPIYGRINDRGITVTIKPADARPYLAGLFRNTADYCAARYGDLALAQMSPARATSKRPNETWAQATNRLTEGEDL
jgi:hypothetical protein